MSDDLEGLTPFKTNIGLPGGPPYEPLWSAYVAGRILASASVEALMRGEVMVFKGRQQAHDFMQEAADQVPGCASWSIRTASINGKDGTERFATAFFMAPEIDEGVSGSPKQRGVNAPLLSIAESFAPEG